MTNIKELMGVSQQLPCGMWVPARPLNYQCRSLRERMKDAWAVFVGDAEAVTWERLTPTTGDRG